MQVTTACALLPILLLAAPIAAQEAAGGRIAPSAVGRAGQRQTGAEARTDVTSVARVETRIQNRVQSRITNRIGPTYAPQTTILSPFIAAEQQTRTTAPRRRR